ncbi:RNA-directed DNA polymerase from mobile element jockey [Blattella germanica]|nr:RNA-directed DNA polymerase from mobile element jockey [Blattella germanica]
MKLWRISRALTNNPIETNAKIIHGSTGVQYEPANTIADTLELQFQPNTTADVDIEEEIQTFTDDYLANIRPNMQLELKTTPAKLKDMITRLNTHKACGPDGISGLMLKNMNRKALVLLTHIYNKCFHLNHFPTPWKTTKIITIPKTGQNPRFPQNRRPISLLSILSKIYERLLLKEVKDHITTHRIIPLTQFGFTPDHNTTLQLSRLIDTITTSFSNTAYTLGVFLDIEKAFDKTWHEGLIYKLIKYDFPSQLVKIIACFLNNRKFRVNHNGGESSTTNIQAGVPQGSVLAPILYNIYTSDIPTSPQVNLALYADDTAIYTSNRNLRYARLTLQR